MKNEFYSQEADLTIHSAFEKINKSLPAAMIQENDFEDIYGKEDILKDINEVEKLENIFHKFETADSRQQFERAAVLEYIIYHEGELNEWFGAGVVTVKTSKYDDIKNGIDLVVEFEEDAEKYLGLAVDVSFGMELEKKLGRIKSEIDGGNLGKVKYYKSIHSGKKSLYNVPRVVIALDKKTTDELAEQWLENKREELSKHPAQFQILSEMLLQLKVYEKYAEVVAKNKEVTLAYRNLRTIVNKILADKKTELGNYKPESFDKGYDTISAGLAKFEHEINKHTPKISEQERRRQLFEKHPYLKNRS